MMKISLFYSPRSNPLIFKDVFAKIHLLNIIFTVFFKIMFLYLLTKKFKEIKLSVNLSGGRFDNRTLTIPKGGNGYE